MRGSSQPNWAKLYSQGRVKYPGMPWSKEELEALKNGISPDDVRDGILSSEEKQKKEEELDEEEKNTGEVSIYRMTKSELISYAKKLGIDFDETSVIKEDLKKVIQQHKERE